jgi:hypothetical protein
MTWQLHSLRLKVAAVQQQLHLLHTPMRVHSHRRVHALAAAQPQRNVTPTFYKNKNFCANMSAYKNAYQIIVLVKNIPKINLA